MACLRFSPVRAADEPPRPPASFEPGDISIGEPIALPFAAPAPAREGTAATPAPASLPTTPLAANTATAPNGWLGMAVAESTVAGRWSIVEVVLNGPAAAAGIRTGDELRAIDGVALTNADEVAQAMTAIASGQNVRLSVARADQVGDVALVAVPRPVASASREWQAAPQQQLSPIETRPPVVAVPPVAPPAANAAPTASVLVQPRTPVPPSAPIANPPVPVVLPASSAAVPPPAFVTPQTAAVAVAPMTTAVSAARGRTALGVRTVPIDPDIQARFRLPEAAGAYVIGVVGDLPASKAGVPPGSVIVKLGDRPVRSPQELTQLVAAGPVDRPVALEYILPGGAEKRADVVLQSLEQPLEQALVGDASMQPTAAPTLEPGPAPRTSRRPVTPAEAEAGELRREVGLVRAWLDVLERRLERLTRNGR
ncbi:MAG: PDZ domain-containing protein [Planctomycetia bacterium]|nr:PDZ domain-containing protein [Planctomycetia bacterium]